MPAPREEERNGSPASLADQPPRGSRHAFFVPPNVWLEQGRYCHKCFYYSVPIFSSSLPRKSIVFSGLFCLLQLPLAFSGCRLLQSPICDIWETKRKCRKFTIMFNCRVPSQSTFVAPFGVFLCLSLAVCPEFLDVLKWRYWEK